MPQNHRYELVAERLELAGTIEQIRDYRGKQSSLSVATVT